MKFEHSSNFKSIMASYVKRSGRALLMPFSMLYNRFRVARQMAKNPSSLMNKASTDVVNQVRRLGEAPQSISEYKGLGDRKSVV